MAEKFPFQIVSPDGKSYDGEAELLNLVLVDGAIGIMKGHLPLVGIIDIARMDAISRDSRVSFAINGGILKVESERTLILADSFELASSIDKERANKAKARAEDRIKKASSNPDIDVKRAELALKRALNRLDVAE